MDSQTRGDFLLRIADLIAEAREELAYLDAVDMGKPLREAEGDVDDAIHCYRYYAGLIKMPQGGILMRRGGQLWRERRLWGDAFLHHP